jgi:SAM-dependent methyltransferase
MTATTAQTGTAERWGPLWGARPQDWAATEEQQAPTYEDAIGHVGIESGSHVLEVGCGSGVFLRMAADRGASVAGLDASPALLEIARSRVPEADLRVGDLQFLPYADDTFDLVAGFNAFFFADDIVAALREAARVAKPGAPVVIQVWGRPDRCDLEGMKHEVAEFLPPPDPNAVRGSELWEPGVLEALVSAAGLAPTDAFDCAWAYEYPDEDALVRGMLSAGGLALVQEARGDDAVGRAVVRGLAGCRTADGGYSVANEWHFVVARA